MRISREIKKKKLSVVEFFELLRLDVRIYTLRVLVEN